MCMFTLWYPSELCRLQNVHPGYYNSLLYSLISSGKNSAHFLQRMPFTMLNFSFHQVLITAGWTEAAWYERSARYLCTQGQQHDSNTGHWRLVTHPSTNHCRRWSTSAIWHALVTAWPCSRLMWCVEKPIYVIWYITHCLQSVLNEPVKHGLMQIYLTTLKHCSNFLCFPCNM